MTQTLGVRDQLFLLAHDDEGRARIHVPSLGAGLAAATLIDLVYAEKIGIAKDRLYMASRELCGDLIGDMVLTNMHQDRTTRSVVDWMRWLALDITARTGSLLHAAGIVSQEFRRPLLGRQTVVYRPTHPNHPGRVLAAAAYAVNGHQASKCTMAFCGLIGVLRLEQVLCINLPSSDLLQRLFHVARGCEPVVQDLISVAEQLVGEQATAAYR